jgi:hypothetical protein
MGNFRKKIVGIGGIVMIAIAALLSYSLFQAYHYPVFDLRIHDPESCSRGYTLVAPVVDDIGLRHEVPNTIYLIDNEAVPVHSWQILGAVQLARLTSDGNMLYATRDRSFPHRAGLREVDPYGNVIWYYKCRIDHDFHILDNGNILLHSIEDLEIPDIGTGKIRSSRIVEVTPQKQVVWTWRAEDHLNELAELAGFSFPLDNPDSLHIIDGAYDWAHNNACRVIPENKAASIDSRFQAGNILFSYCNLNTIGIIDRISGRIIWTWGPGILDGQHDPRMLSNGQILLFDNGTERGYSRVIELNPLTEEIIWEYDDRSSDSPVFYSEYKSGAQKLTNGNVFVTQDTYRPVDVMSKFYHLVCQYLLREKIRSSRLFEVNPSGEIVWETIVNSKGDHIYGLYQAPRYSQRYVRQLLKVLDSLSYALDEKRIENLKSLPYIR